MLKKRGWFLFIFIFFSTVFFVSQAITNAEKLQKAKIYLETLREKEYAALKNVLIYANTSPDIIEHYMKFYKDFKQKYAQEIFVHKNQSSFHDPRLAEFPMGNSNILEETKKLLRKCKINPESISIEYDENRNQTIEQRYTFFSNLPKFILNPLNTIYLLFSLHAVAYVNVEMNKNLVAENEKIYLENFIEALSQGKLYFKLAITKRGVLSNYSLFNHIILHEASHLLEGDVVISSTLPSVTGDLLKNDQKFSKILNNFGLRQEIIADVRMYLELGQKHLLHALRAHHVFVKGTRGQTHPATYSTYKRLTKINKATWNIPFYKYIFFEGGISLLKTAVASAAAGVGLGLIGIMIKKLKK